MLMKQVDIGALLVQEGIISAGTLEKAKIEASRRGETLEYILLDTGSVEERDLAWVRGCAMKIEFIDLERVTIDEEIARCIPEHLAFRHRVIPVRLEGDVLVLAMADPVDVIAMDDIRLLTGFNIRPAIAAHSAIMRHLKRSFRGEEKDLSQAPPQRGMRGGPGRKLSPEKILELADEAPIVRVVNLIISEAINDRASEILLIPEEEVLTVSYIINDVLTPVMSAPWHIQQPVMARIKIMANLNPLREGIAQRGVITLNHGGCTYRLTVLTDHGEWGETVTLLIGDSPHY
jgi:type IV pilus assembly protein PilB